jgi:hypothetical protein
MEDALRSTEEVFTNHLALARIGDLETDLARNFAPECVLLTGYGTFTGHAGVRQAADLLGRQLPGARFTYRTRLWHGEIAFLEWEAAAEGGMVRDGADSFLVRDGLIRVMTIHYTPLPK